jgi:hypothetical protein
LPLGCPPVLGSGFFRSRHPDESVAGSTFNPSLWPRTLKVRTMCPAVSCVDHGLRSHRGG